MENFTYQCQTKIIFGKKTEDKVGEETEKFSNKILLHYGTGSIKKTGLYDRIVKSLNNHNIKFIELSGVVPNPRLDLVNKGIKICRENNINFILAIGGGSVIDSAKTIAAGYYYQGDVWDFFTKRISITKTLPIGVVLTIPAAGSESSPNAVITKNEQKLAITSDQLRPQFAILNPELTFSLPLNQTVAGIADMFAHIVERYFTNTKNTDLTDKLCEATFRSIIKNARLVIKNPDNYDCRGEIMLAGNIAHNGILGVGRNEDWASHRIEHQLSAIYDVTHGEGLAVIVPAWMKYVYKHDINRFVQYANKVWGIKGNGEKTALKGIAATKEFFKELGLPKTLKELNIDDTKFNIMAKKSSPTGNFVKLNEKDVLEIYRMAL